MLIEKWWIDGRLANILEWIRILAIFLTICADLGMEVMHERNAHNFPLDLA